MPIKHTEQEVINSLKEYIDDPRKMLPLLYKAPFITRYGETLHTKKKYYDIVADYLLKEIDIIDLFEKNIIKISRREKGKSYNAGHPKLKIEEKKRILKNKNAGEDEIAKCLFGDEIEQIGKIIDYQIPIANEESQSVGVVDMLSYKDNILSLIEFKKQNNKETLLRAILEIYTYYQHIKHIEELKEDFCYPNADIQNVVLIFKDSFLDKQTVSDNIKMLAEKFKVKIISIEPNILETL